MLAMAKHMPIIRTGDPQQPTGGRHEVQIATIGRLLSKPVGIRGRKIAAQTKKANGLAFRS